MAQQHAGSLTNEPIVEQIRALILRAIPDAAVEVREGGGGHFSITVTSAVFAGRSLLDKQRLVMGAIADLMRGEGAPVHAIDRLETRVAPKAE